MKKLLSILIVLLLVTSSACANTSYLIGKYNSLAKNYGAPVLNLDMLKEETEKVTKFLCGDTWIMFGAINSTEINSASVVGADSTDFLPACVSAAFTISKSADGAVDFMGALLYAYMTVKSGKEKSFGYFNSLYFTISSTEQGLQFLIGEP